MNSSTPEFITIGRIIAPWGVHGQLKVEVITEFPERLAKSSKIYVDKQPVTIENTEWSKGRAIIKLSTVNNLEEAGKLRDKLLEIHHSQIRSLPDGHYYHFQLIGLEVITTRGETLGDISEILTGASNDNYVVNGSEGQILIPAIEDIVKAVDLDRGCVIIEPIEGLLNLNKKARS